jgi:GNAT superfamily N-acetyltransferase
MELHRTDEGFALYKEKTQIGFCALTPAAKGAAITAFGIEPQWRRKGYGSYLLKEALRAYAGYDREKATVFTAPLPADAAELAFWAKFGFAAEGRQLVRRQVRAGLSGRAAGTAAPLHRCYLRQRRRHGLPVRHHRAGRKGSRL